MSALVVQTTKATEATEAANATSVGPKRDKQIRQTSHDWQRATNQKES